MEIAMAVLATFCIVGQATNNFKRHYHEGKPRSDPPLCVRVCEKMQDQCSANCFPPDGTAHTPFSTTIPREELTVSKNDSKKYECIDKCLNSDSEPIIQQESCDEFQPAPRSGKGEGEVEIDVSSLTMEERCGMEAFRNSSVCRLEQDQPTVSKLVFDVNKPKLTLCTGSPVLSGKRGLYTLDATKAFGKRRENLLESSVRRKRSIRKDSGFVGRLRRSSITEPYEFCPTKTTSESPRMAIHFASKQFIDIYFYAGYSQWFEMGVCELERPAVGLSNGSHCGMAMSKVKAWVIFNPAEFEGRDKVKGCGTIKKSEYKICQDWVLIPTHCKHYYSRN